MRHEGILQHEASFEDMAGPCRSFPWDLQEQSLHRRSFGSCRKDNAWHDSPQRNFVDHGGLQPQPLFGLDTAN